MENTVYFRKAAKQHGFPVDALRLFSPGLTLPGFGSYLLNQGLLPSSDDSLLPSGGESKDQKSPAVVSQAN